MQAKYGEHPVFEKPANENAKIWKYMDFTKFASLLDKKALFFCRADKFDDPFEGSYSSANISLRPQVYDGKIPPKFLKQMAEINKQEKRFHIINCWNLSDCESAALWKLYIKNSEGVAIQSTFNRLKHSFASEASDYVYIGKVQYIDYEKDWLPEGNVFYPFVHKRKSFEHEKELRAVIAKYPISQDGKSINVFTTEEMFDTGEYVDVDLTMLIEKVYISPTAPEWFKSLVRSITEKYGLNLSPLKSNLDRDPVY